MSKETSDFILIKPTDNKERDYNNILILKDKNIKENICPKDLCNINCKDYPRIDTCDKVIKLF